MKLAKKILVGIIAVAMLASAFMLTTSAEAPSCPIENFADLLEYGVYDTYLVEEYENYEEGEFKFDPDASEYVTDSIFGFIQNGGASASVVEEDDNNYLKLSTKDKSFIGYKFIAENDAEMIDRIVFSFDFKNSDADFALLATLCDYFEDVPLFAADFSDPESPVFTYARYDQKRAIYVKTVADHIPAVDEWYHIDLVFNPASGTISVSVEADGVSVLSYSNNILGTKGIDSIRLYAKADEEGEGSVSIDNLYAYEGTAPRVVVDPDNALASILIQLDEYAKHPEVSPEEKLEIAEAYKMLYKGENGGMVYTAPAGIDKYEEMVAIVNGVDAYINCADANAFIVYAERATKVEGYYAKIEYREEFVEAYYNTYSAIADLESVEGFDLEFALDVTYAEAIKAAIKSYEAETKALETTRKYSINFVEQIEKLYNPSSKDYADMVNKYNAFSLLVGKIDLSYVYADDVPTTKYPTVADAYAVFEALGVKIEEITKNALAFKEIVYAMDTTQVDELVDGEPFLTVDFEGLYANYLVAETLLKNGTVHASLNPATFSYVDYVDPSNNFNLSKVIEEYLVKKAYVEERVAVCNTFVSIITGANTSSYYITVKSEIERAALYIDNDKEYSLERLPEVEAAIALYDGIVARVNKNYEDAQIYIAAAEALDIALPYVVLRAAVDELLLLQKDGNITGIEGVEDANIKLEKALAIVETLEGNSSTLINTVEALKSATTLAARRSYIKIGLNALEGADESIEGVAEAAVKLMEALEAYEADVAAINSYFFGVVDNASAVISGSVTSDAVNSAAGIIAGLE